MNRKTAPLILLSAVLLGATGGTSVSAAYTVDASTACAVGATVVGVTVGASSFSLGSVSAVVDMRRPLPVSFSIDANISMTGAALRYRRVGEASYQSAAITPVPAAPSNQLNGLFQIPAQYLQGNPTLQYYVEISHLDAGGNPQVLPFAAASLLGVGDSARALLGPGGGRLEMEDGYADDGKAFIDVPAGALQKAGAVTGRALDPAGFSAPSGQVAAASFALTPSSAFKKAVTVGLLYSDLDADGMVDGTAVRETDLRPFWWDGLHWRPMGRGTVDAAGNVVTFLAHMPGAFALLPAAADAQASLRPLEKIATPDGDGVNDFAVFDGVASGTRIVILDLGGRVVRDISDSNVWDGRDDDGGLVESGLYVYQVHSDRGIVTGTIVLAK